MEERKNICNFCGAVLDDDHTFVYDDTVMCEDCFDEHTLLCDCCGDRMWKDEAEGDTNITLCSYCYDNRYVYCDHCSRLIHRDDAYYFEDDDAPYCQTCYERELHNRVIHDYSYKPEPIFYGEKMYLGVELEVDEGGEDDDCANTLLDIANKDNEHMYIKHDGSLDEGFEMVTHPMDLNYHINTMPWKDILKKAVQMGYRSHQTNTCGLHVHINRTAFGETTEEQEEAIARVVYFVEAHWNEMLKFSRRTEYSINRWAARYGLKDTPKGTYKDAKDKYMGRYVCVNLTNYNTIELRIFRGTLRYETLIAALQMVSEICNTAVSLSDEEMQKMTWNDFVLDISRENKELISYLKQRRLYVNDAVPAEEEI